MTSQLPALVRLRWRMVRSARTRWGFAALAASVPAAAAAAVLVGQLAPADYRTEATLLAPTAYVSVAVIALLAPLVAGGGNELFPDSQLVAYPVTARTTYITSLALTPLNLAWTSQLVGLLGVTSYIAPLSATFPLALVTALAYLGLVTVAGQAVGWAVVGVRQTRRGRLLTWTVAAGAAVLGVSLVVAGRLADVLDSTPATWVVIAALNGAEGYYTTWTWITATLLSGALAAWVLGARVCAWALRRPGGAADRIDARHVPRRRPAPSIHRELLRVDRASVWRSSSIRRGLLVLGLLPGGIAAAADLDWPTLTLLPGLVAAGAGLLFGVNVFSLDGAGGVWLAAQPHDPAHAFWSKARVVTEVCAVGIVLTVAAGSVRTGRWPTPDEAAALACCTAVVVARVVALCLALSVRRPHRADLRGPRDSPAPPGVMAAYSARLALTTTLVALLFSGLAELAGWRWSVAVAVPFLLLSIRGMLAARRAWLHPVVRSRVVLAVANG